MGRWIVQFTQLSTGGEHLVSRKPPFIYRVADSNEPLTAAVIFGGRVIVGSVRQFTDADSDTHFTNLRIVSDSDGIEPARLDNGAWYTTDATPTLTWDLANEVDDMERVAQRSDGSFGPGRGPVEIDVYNVQTGALVVSLKMSWAATPAPDYQAMSQITLPTLPTGDYIAFVRIVDDIVDGTNEPSTIRFGISQQPAGSSATFSFAPLFLAADGVLSSFPGADPAMRSADAFYVDGARLLVGGTRFGDSGIEIALWEYDGTNLHLLATAPHEYASLPGVRQFTAPNPPVAVLRFADRVYVLTESALYLLDQYALVSVGPGGKAIAKSGGDLLVVTSEKAYIYTPGAGYLTRDTESLVTSGGPNSLLLYMNEIYSLLDRDNGTVLAVFTGYTDKDIRWESVVELGADYTHMYPARNRMFLTGVGVAAEYRWTSFRGGWSTEFSPIRWTRSGERAAGIVEFDDANGQRSVVVDLGEVAAHDLSIEWSTQTAGGSTPQVSDVSVDWSRNTVWDGPIVSSLIIGWAQNAATGTSPTVADLTLDWATSSASGTSPSTASVSVAWSPQTISDGRPHVEEMSVEWSRQVSPPTASEGVRYYRHTDPTDPCRALVLTVTGGLSVEQQLRALVRVDLESVPEDDWDSYTPLDLASMEVLERAGYTVDIALIKPNSTPAPDVGAYLVRTEE